MSNRRKLSEPGRRLVRVEEQHTRAALDESDRESVPSATRVTSAEPERRMLLAILEDAIDQILELGLAKPDAPLRSEPERWIFSNDRKRPFSFVNVCETLNVDPQWLRDKIRAELRKRNRRPALMGSAKDAARRDSR